jgi:metaxin
MKEEAYMSLIDHTLRNAWLYHLYLDTANFQSVAWPLYVDSTSSNVMVRQAIARQLRTAAQDELLKTYTIIDSGELYERTEEAFKALSTLMGDNQYFFGSEKPGLFDASLFAYTHLLLDEEMGWKSTTLTGGLAKYDNLVQHRNRLLKQYFGP